MKLIENSVQVKSKDLPDRFTMRLPSVYMIIFYGIAVVSMGGMFFGVYVKSVLLILFFVLATLWMFLCGTALAKEKIEVSNNEIWYRSFIRKDKKISFSQIKYIERRFNGKGERISVYSDNGQEFGYDTSYKNAELFERLIVKQGWEF